MNRVALAVLVLGGASLPSSVGCRCDAPPSERKPEAVVRDAATSGDAERGNPRATTLLDRRESAYGTTLFVEGPAVLLLTPTAAIRLTDGAAPETRTVPLGVGPTLLGDSILYWHDGAARTLSPHAREPHALGPIARPPQRFVAWENRLAWLDRTDDGTYTLQTFDGKTPRVLHRTRDHVAAATMLDRRVFFVERLASGGWRIGRVSSNEAEPVFSDAHQGRTPSMLVPGPDGIYFYDGPSRSVRRASPDLKQETVIAEDVICSPLAVSDRVLCGHVEGVYEIPGKNRAPRVLSAESAGPIAAIAADEKRVVWVIDAAQNQLAVRSMPLPPPP